jgi:hypothetical protein
LSQLSGMRSRIVSTKLFVDAVRVWAVMSGPFKMKVSAIVHTN